VNLDGGLPLGSKCFVGSAVTTLPPPAPKAPFTRKQLIVRAKSMYPIFVIAIGIDFFILINIIPSFNVS
jgi:hypothetical protein